jgi:hypothetical protein
MGVGQYFVRDGEPRPSGRLADDGLHIYVDGPPQRARVHDEAPVVASMGLPDPTDPRSGQQSPAGHGGFQVDFRLDLRSGRWLGQDRAGRRFRLLLSRDNSCYRVSSEEDLPPLGAQGQRAGDEALNGDLTRIHDDARHAAGLARWQSLLDGFWRRKEEA